VINSFGAGQDNVVFLGRRSFRMELAGRPGGDALGIPQSASEIPTEKIFDSDRERAVHAAVASLQPKSRTSSLTLIALCSTTFALGIALTLTFYYRTEPRQMLAAVPLAPAQVAPPPPPAPPMVIQPLPPPPVEAVAFAPAPASGLARRPRAKPPAPPARPRPAHALPSDPPAPKPWVDPFAE
jgi:hypothetical protein